MQLLQETIVQNMKKQRGAHAKSVFDVRFDGVANESQELGLWH
jgi:hypothetical protein